jgi:GMP synthase (glutamine-hydrolysing)
VGTWSRCFGRIEEAVARILAVLHSTAEPLGALEPPIVTAGHVIETRVMPGSLPTSLAGYEGLIVMGGTMGVYDADRYPFLVEEVRLLREALSAGLPTLGVCLGSQLLASAGGALVYPGAAGIEIGWHPVTRHADDPWLAGWPASFEPLAWHGDTFDLPDGATLLASSRLYPHQAFRLGSGLGLQFHVEATSALVREWFADPDLPERWRPAPEHVARAEEAVARMAPLAEGLGAAFARAAWGPAGAR